MSQNNSQINKLTQSHADCGQRRTEQHAFASALPSTSRSQLVSNPAAVAHAGIPSFMQHHQPTVGGSIQFLPSTMQQGQQRFQAPLNLQRPSHLQNYVPAFQQVGNLNNWPFFNSACEQKTTGYYPQVNRTNSSLSPLPFMQLPRQQLPPLHPTLYQKVYRAIPVIDPHTGKQVTAVLKEPVSNLEKPNSHAPNIQNSVLSVATSISVSEGESMISTSPSNISGGTVCSEAQKRLLKSDRQDPLKSEERKQYDRDFLLQLRFQPMTVCKPPNLRKLDVIKDKVYLLDAFGPPYIRERKKKLKKAKSHPTGNQNELDSQNENKEALNTEVTMMSWKVLSKEKIKKILERDLKKFILRNSEIYVSEIKYLNIDSEEELSFIVDVIFEQAINELGASYIFANLCKHLALIKVPVANTPGIQIDFRKLLLTKCQWEFEEITIEKQKEVIDTEDPKIKRTLESEFEMQERNFKYRQLGNITFMGELFKLGMLIEPIMHECIQVLLNQEDDLSLECMCQLLKTTGKELDEMQTANTKQNQMDMYFMQIQTIMDKPLADSRLRFMLQDIIDLRKNNWVPRWDKNNTEIIDPIKNEKERKAQELQCQNVTHCPQTVFENTGNMSCFENHLMSSSKRNTDSCCMIDLSKLESTEGIEGTNKQLHEAVNKIFPENFEAILEKIQIFQKGTEFSISCSLVNVIHEQAMSEASVISLCAQLCKDLIVCEVSRCDANETPQNSFESFLFKKCQEEFDMNINYEEECQDVAEVTQSVERNKLQPENDIKFCSRLVRNVRFILELFKLGLLIEPTIAQIINKFSNQGDEVSLKCLFQFWKIIDRNLDEATKLKRAGQVLKQNILQKRLQELVKELSLESFEQFLEEILSLHLSNKTLLNFLIDITHVNAVSERSSGWAKLEKQLIEKKNSEHEIEEIEICPKQIRNVRCLMKLNIPDVLIEPIVLVCIDKLVLQGDEESLASQFRLWRMIQRKLDEVSETKTNGKTHVI